MIRDLIKKIVYYWQLKRIASRVTLLGSNYWVNQNGRVNLADNSDKADIVIGDFVEIYGHLMSQNHGKIIIGNYVQLGRNCKINAVEQVTIGNYVVVSENVVIVDTNNHPLSINFRKVGAMMPRNSTLHLWKYAEHKPVVIGDNVWIGENARICKGVTIGDNSVIAANSVVTKNIPANSIAAGNPAKIVREGSLLSLEEPKDCEEYNTYMMEHGEIF